AENVGALGGHHQKGKIVLADLSLARGAVTKNRWLALGIGAHPVPVYLSLLVPHDARSVRRQLRKPKVEERAVVRQPRDGGVLRPGDSFAKPLAGIHVHYVQDAIF